MKEHRTLNGIDRVRRKTNAKYCPQNCNMDLCILVPFYWLYWSHIVCFASNRLIFMNNFIYQFLCIELLSSYTYITPSYFIYYITFTNYILFSCGSLQKVSNVFPKFPRKDFYTFLFHLNNLLCEPRRGRTDPLHPEQKYIFWIVKHGSYIFWNVELINLAFGCTHSHE